ncbi:MAG: Hpt domain-containing protein [Proteobacteria bacterium]|nr:Hpt domain-containing protein [Pseudomonadota bacterium]
MDDLLADFLREADQRAAEAQAALGRLRAGGAHGPAGRGALALIRRHLHGIKGIAGCLGLPRMERLAHLAEDALAGPAPSADALDQAAQALTGIARAATGLAAALPPPAAAFPLPAFTVSAPGLPSAHGGDAARVSDAWGALPILARQLAGRLGKRVALTLEGGETPLSRAALPPLREALAQMLRNAIDHGIEPPAERRAAGKPEVGALRVSARAVPGAALIEVADDGSGLALDRIRAEAAALGLGTPAALAAMADADAAQLVFSPGLSTAARPGLISGRGVGLDAAASGLAEIGGRAEAISTPGRGCLFVLTLPAPAPGIKVRDDVLDGALAV